MTQVSRRDVAVALGASTIVLANSAHARDGVGQVATLSPINQMDIILTDPSDGRTIKVRLFAPPPRQRGKRGFIVFSHGANSSGELYDAILAPLAASGFVIAAATHVDSETNPNRALFNQAKVMETRLRDLQILGEMRSDLARRIGVDARQFDANATLIAGHSYGALLALYLVGAGQVPIGTVQGTPAVSASNPIYRAAIAISPPGPMPGFLKAEQFETIAKPILVTTGEKDVLGSFVPEWQMRLSAFEHARLAPAFAAILPDVDHYFGGALGRLTLPGPPQTQSLLITTQIASLFARAFGEKDASALRELTMLTRRPSRYPQLDLRRRN